MNWDFFLAQRNTDWGFKDYLLELFHLGCYPHLSDFRWVLCPSHIRSVSSTHMSIQIAFHDVMDWFYPSKISLMELYVAVGWKEGTNGNGSNMSEQCRRNWGICQKQVSTILEEFNRNLTSLFLSVGPRLLPRLGCCSSKLNWSDCSRHR